MLPASRMTLLHRNIVLNDAEFSILAQCKQHHLRPIVDVAIRLTLSRRTTVSGTVSCACDLTMLRAVSLCFSPPLPFGRTDADTLHAPPWCISLSQHRVQHGKLLPRAQLQKIKRQCNAGQVPETRPAGSTQVICDQGKHGQSVAVVLARCGKCRAATQRSKQAQVKSCTYVGLSGQSNSTAIAVVVCPCLVLDGFPES